MKKHLLLITLCLCFLIKIKAQTNVFEKEIHVFESADSASKPVVGQILLYGSSTIRLWESYEKDFSYKNLKVVNRGFGGSQTSDANLFFERVVIPHHPKVIFFYEGDNDLNAGKSVETVFEDYKVFVQKVKTQLADTKIVIFAVKPSPSRIQFFEKQKQLNRQLWRYVKRQKNVYFIDTFSRMLDKSGKPDPKFFKTDMLHMKPEGYTIWTAQAQRFLKKHVK